MKLYLFPPSGHAVGIVALKNHVALDRKLKPIDLGRGDQRAPQYQSLTRTERSRLAGINYFFRMRRAFLSGLCL